MALEIHMPEPLCLIENSEEQLVVNQEALDILSGIMQPVVVVAIVCLYHTGKSYLVNKLAGQKRGFSVGSTVQSHTKGIWMLCVPHPKKPDQTLVLLDTEGLGDVEKVDEKIGTKIFALAILLSSTFIYNTMNKIEQGATDLLHNMTELTDLLRTRNSPDFYGIEDDADFASFFPDLVWTSDKYLENSLRLKPGKNQKIQNFNLPHLCIQKFSPVKKCFIFDSPTHWKKLAQLETLYDDELDPEFVQQVSEFCSYIFSHSKTKTLPGDIKVNGPRLENLVLTYVNAINSGDLPCMENAAMDHYEQKMDQKVQLPTETLQELLDLQRACEREAIEIFRKNSFKDEDQSFQKELEAQLHAKQNDICKQNLDTSSDRCSALLQDIFGPLEEAVKQGIYSKPGGHTLFLHKTEELKAKYYQQPRKGIQAEEALQKYLKSKESVSEAILQTDQALTTKEKEKEAERVRVEAAKPEVQRLEAICRYNQQQMEEKRRLHQQQVRQMEINRVNFLAQQQRAQEQWIRVFISCFPSGLYSISLHVYLLQSNTNSSDDPCVIL
uniref:GB1/RHD3-type G domain-containing protein n=1 Tax=Castor canadensis TaxID=51338 RepID=A0A8C0W3L9_CASCN